MGRLALLLALSTVILGQEDPLAAARAAEAAGRFAEAETHYERVLAARPDAEVYQRLGLVRHLQNKFAEAIPAFEKAVAANPRLWASQLFLGVAYYRVNRFGEALARLEGAEKLQPGQPEIHYWLGATQIALGRHLRGMEILERLLQRDAKNIEALRLLAQQYAEYHSLVWSGVAERHFQTPAGYEVHGHALELEGAYDAAIDAYRQSLNLEPGRTGPHLAIGRALLRKGRPREALPEFETELRRQPGDPEASYYLALAFFQQKRYADALPHAEAAASYAPDARSLLARIREALGRAGKPAP